MTRKLNALYRPPHAVAYTANGHTFWMIPIPKGGFWMGEERKYQIELAHDYELGQFPVTQALWQAVMEENPAHFKGQDRPVEQVDIEDVELFLDRLNTLAEIEALNTADGQRFQLPTEAQWEYAARGGQYAEIFDYRYAGSTHLPEVGWYNENSHHETQTVGRKRPNALGLYEMSGNVWEWCEASWLEGYPTLSWNGISWQGSEESIDRVVRSGSWVYNDSYCRLSYRNGNFDHSNNTGVGFRLARY